MWPFGPSRRERALQADVDAMSRTLEYLNLKRDTYKRRVEDLQAASDENEALRERIVVLEAERREADEMRDLACAERDRWKAAPAEHDRLPEIRRIVEYYGVDTSLGTIQSWISRVREKAADDVRREMNNIRDARLASAQEAQQVAEDKIAAIMDIIDPQ